MSEDIRLATIREICDKEGHGHLIEITTFADLPNRRHICNRGCGTNIIEFDKAMTLGELAAMLQRTGATGTIRVRGTAEIRAE